MAYLFTNKHHLKLPTSAMRVLGEILADGDVLTRAELDPHLREVMKDTREAAQIGDWHTALSKKVLRRASRSRFGVIIRTVFPKRGYAPSCSRMSSTTRTCSPGGSSAEVRCSPRCAAP